MRPLEWLMADAAPADGWLAVRFRTWDLGVVVRLRRVSAGDKGRRSLREESCMLSGREHFEDEYAPRFGWFNLMVGQGNVQGSQRIRFRVALEWILVTRYLRLILSWPTLRAQAREFCEETLRTAVATALSTRGMFDGSDKLEDAAQEWAQDFAADGLECWAFLTAAVRRAVRLGERHGLRGSEKRWVERGQAKVFI